MINSWIKFWAMLSGFLHVGYNASLTARFKSDQWVHDALKDVDIKQLNEELKAMGLYLE